MKSRWIMSDNVLKVGTSIVLHIVLIYIVVGIGIFVVAFVADLFIR